MGASSSASFTGQGAFGTESATVSNAIDNLHATLMPAYGTTPDTSDGLTQYGSSTVSTKSPDLQKPADFIKKATATAGENMALSGNYGMATDNDPIYAQFDNEVSTTIGGITAKSVLDRSDYPTTGDKDPAFSAQIEPEGAFIVDAKLGSATNVGFEKINAIGAVPTLSGSVNNWANFAGAYGVDNKGVPTGRGFSDIETSVANEQRFQLTS